MCGIDEPHLEVGIYRPGSYGMPNPTSTIDFDYIKITKGNKINSNHSNSNDDRVTSAQAANNPYQSNFDKQIRTMIGALNGFAEQKLWIKKAELRGLSKYK